MCVYLQTNVFTLDSARLFATSSMFTEHNDKTTVHKVIPCTVVIKMCKQSNNFKCVYFQLSQVLKLLFTIVKTFD